MAIVGGGLAGLAAGCALADAGFRVTLLERKSYLGGRASSYQYPGTGEIIDNCQHVLLGCCTNLIDLYRRIGADRLIRWYDRLTFIEPGGRRSVIGSCSLPAPLHTAPSFLGASALGIRDKIAVVRALLAMIMRVPPDDGRSFLDWLQAHGQTSRAIERFWKVVLVSALNEDLDRVSISTAAMVFRESFLKSRCGGLMGVPRVPLTELYSLAGDYISSHGGRIETHSVVEEVNIVACRESAWRQAVGTGQSTSGTRPQSAPGEFASKPGVKLTVNGQPRMFDYAVLATAFGSLEPLLGHMQDYGPLQAQVAQLETSPITGVHLWFDREITELDHAVLLDRTIQWMFHKSRLLDRCAASVPRNEERETGNVSSVETAGSYIELVVSASKSLISKSRQEVIELAVRELADYFPRARQARLLKATVVKEVHATFSPMPGTDARRPNPQTPWPGIFLAGDWIATGWPATMEGAVRSGYLAAEALAAACNGRQQFLAPDLSPSGFMRLLRK